MFHFKENAHEFWQGFIGGGLVLTPVFLRIDFGISETTADAVIRILSIAGSALVVGMFNVIGREVIIKYGKYGWRLVYWIKDKLWLLKNKLFKPKNKDHGTGSDRYKQNGKQERA